MPLQRLGISAQLKKNCIYLCLLMHDSSSIIEALGNSFHSASAFLPPCPFLSNIHQFRGSRGQVKSVDVQSESICFEMRN